jgi:hypothetical protein
MAKQKTSSILEQFAKVKQLSENKLHLVPLSFAQSFTKKNTLRNFVIM